MLQLVMLHLRKRSEPNQAFLLEMGGGVGGGGINKKTVNSRQMQLVEDTFYELHTVLST